VGKEREEWKKEENGQFLSANALIRDFQTPVEVGYFSSFCPHPFFLLPLWIFIQL
jgi:hypothetical protein